MRRHSSPPAVPDLPSQLEDPPLPSSRPISSARSAISRENPARASNPISFIRPAAPAFSVVRNGPIRRLRTKTSAAASSVSAPRTEAPRATSGATPFAISRACTARCDGPPRTSVLARLSTNAASLTAPAATSREITPSIVSRAAAITGAAASGSVCVAAQRSTCRVSTRRKVEYDGVPMVKIGREFLLRKNGARKRNGH